MHRIFVFLSTPRTGTQWLAANLARIYGDLASVTHEPIGPLYRPREYFRAYDRVEDMLAVPEIADHMAHIEERTTSKAYIELGWQSYAAIPLFVHRFGKRVAVIQLTRNPVSTAASLVTHRFYAGSSRNDAHTRLGLLDPWTPGVKLADYADRWARLSPYERCLFYWTEIYMYGEELSARLSGNDFLVARMEDVLSGDAAHLEALTSFLELPFRSELTRATDQVVDARKKRTDLKLDPTEVLDHPHTLGLAARLKYDVRSIDGKTLRRYRNPLWRRAAHSRLILGLRTLFRTSSPPPGPLRTKRPDGERPRRRKAPRSGHMET